MPPQEGSFILTPREAHQLLLQMHADPDGDITFDKFVASLMDWSKVGVCVWGGGLCDWVHLCLLYIPLRSAFDKSVASLDWGTVGGCGGWWVVFQGGAPGFKE